MKKLHVSLLMLFLCAIAVAQNVNQPGYGITSAGYAVGIGSYSSTYFGDSAGTLSNGYSNTFMGSN